MARTISTVATGSSLGPLLVLTALLLLLACGGGTAPAPTATAAARPAATPAAAAAKIIVLGDSIAAGLGLAEDEAFPAVVERRLRAGGHGAVVVNAGVSGDTTAGGLERLEWLLDQRPSVLVVELGANDALRGQPLVNVEANLRQIVRRARDGGALVVLLGMDIPTNYGPEYGGGFAAMYDRVAHEEDAVLVPGFMREVGLDPDLMQPDGLHPTAAGQERLAAELLPYLDSALASPPQETAAGER